MRQLRGGRATAPSFAPQNLASKALEQCVSAPEHGKAAVEQQEDVAAHTAGTVALAASNAAAM